MQSVLTIIAAMSLQEIRNHDASPDYWALMDDIQALLRLPDGEKGLIGVVLDWGNTEDFL